MTDHDAARELLGTRHDLSPEEEAALLNHLEACQACREIAAEYDRQDEFLRSLSLPAPARSIRQAVLARVERRSSPRRRVAWLAGVPAAAVVVALIVVLALRSHPTGRSTALSSPQFGAQRNSAPHAATDSAANRARKAAAAPAGPLNGPLRVDTLSHGVRLSLIIPRHSYPRDAVIPAEMLITNRSHHLVQVQSWTPYRCAQPKPTVETVDPRGNPVSPLPPGPVPNCPLPVTGPPTPGFLRPGQTMVTRQYVVLVTPRLRITTEVITFGHCDPRQSFRCHQAIADVAGQIATVHLTPSHPPQIALRGSPPSRLVLLSGHDSKSLLWYGGWFVCSFPSRGESRGESFGGIGGTATRGRRIALHLPGCDPNHISIHLVAGPVNGPVASVMYVRPEHH